jgi:hypothetical protein
VRDAKDSVAPPYPFYTAYTEEHCYAHAQSETAPRTGHCFRRHLQLWL